MMKTLIRGTRFGRTVRRNAKRYLYNVRYRKVLQASDFPPEVWIENTNCCNARCVMCPRDKHTRPQGIMDFSTYARLIEEIALYKDAVKRIHLHNYGEPLLDKDLPRKVKFAKEKGIRHTYFVTNAAALTPAMSRDLIEAGLDEFKISFYGTDRETYNSTMRGLDFGTTINNVKDFFRVRAELGVSKPRVIIQYLPQESNKGRTDDFTAIFKDVIGKDSGDSMSIFSLHDFGEGGKNDPWGDDICSICNYPWRTMVILHDGRVVLCCLDYNGVQTMGDVKKNSISEIWNSSAYTKAREDFKKLDYNGYPFCMKCELIR